MTHLDGDVTAVGYLAQSFHGLQHSRLTETMFMVLHGEDRRSSATPRNQNNGVQGVLRAYTCRACAGHPGIVGLAAWRLLQRCTLNHAGWIRRVCAADFMMGHVYGARLVAVLVVR